MYDSQQDSDTTANPEDNDKKPKQLYADEQNEKCNDEFHVSSPSRFNVAYTMSHPVTPRASALAMTGM